MIVGRIPCEDEGRDWVAEAKAEECHKFPADHKKQGERHGMNYPSQPSEDPALPAF